jgi:hypothetical protein
VHAESSKDEKRRAMLFKTSGLWTLVPLIWRFKEAFFNQVILLLDYLLSRVIFLKTGKGLFSKEDPLQVKAMVIAIVGVQLWLYFYVDFCKGRPNHLQATYNTILPIVTYIFNQIL